MRGWTKGVLACALWAGLAGGLLAQDLQSFEQRTKVKVLQPGDKVTL